MWTQLVVDSCSSADSIGRSSGHNSVDHFQSDLIRICIDMGIIEKHFDTLIECMENRVEDRSKEVAIASGRWSNRRRWCHGQYVALCIDISVNCFLFELFQCNQVVQMLGRCILVISSIGQSVDRIDYFDVRLMPTETENCNCTRLFDQSWRRHPHSLELGAIRNYSLQTSVKNVAFQREIVIP
jgi:hypothetical protein